MTLWHKHRPRFAAALWFWSLPESFRSQAPPSCTAWQLSVHELAVLRPGGELPFPGAANPFPWKRTVFRVEEHQPGVAAVTDDDREQVLAGLGLEGLSELRW